MSLPLGWTLLQGGRYGPKDVSKVLFTYNAFKIPTNHTLYPPVSPLHEIPGNRIAIISKGELIMCGSFYLK